MKTCPEVPYAARLCPRYAARHFATGKDAAPSGNDALRFAGGVVALEAGPGAVVHFGGARTPRGARTGVCGARAADGGRGFSRACEVRFGGSRGAESIPADRRVNIWRYLR